MFLFYRQFLWTFHPPGEAQKIERMLEGFSRRYCQSNTSAFEDSSGCFTLAFCSVILNTLLHNDNVKEKPPLKVFVEMVNMEQNLPVEMLEVPNFLLLGKLAVSFNFTIISQEVSLY